MAQELDDRRQREPATLEKADLPRFLLVVCGRRAEAAPPQRDHRLLIVDFDGRERLGCRRTRYTSGLEALPDRALAEGATFVAGELLRKPRVGEKTERRQLLEHRVDFAATGISATG